MIIRLQHADFILGKLDTVTARQQQFLMRLSFHQHRIVYRRETVVGVRETFNQRKLMFNLSTICFGFLLGFVEFFVGGIFFECDLEMSDLRTGAD
jgi:hypothetical protein